MKKENKEKILKYLKHFLIILLIIILVNLMMNFLEESQNLDDGFSFKTIYNLFIKDTSIVTMLIFLGNYLVLKGITGKTKLSLVLVVLVEGIFDIINYVVRHIRGSAITISDITAVRTALSISGKLSSFIIVRAFVVGIVLLIMSILVIFLLKKYLISDKEKVKVRIIKFLIGLMMIILLSFTGVFKDILLWDANLTYSEYGSPITIISMIKKMRVKKPEGYNKYDVESILSEYDTDEEFLEDKPNIIVIVNESFCDYYNLYNIGNRDPIEYVTNLSKEKNVVSGVNYSSEYGGQTSNVEYEFLTQNSTRILPIGSYVFQEYIKRPVTSIVSHLNGLGYKTTAIHPWHSYAYSRNKIYKLFGFDRIKFKDDIEGLENNFNNEFYSDRSTYKEILKDLKEKEDNEKLFEYCLTVQNHIAYKNPDQNQENFTEDNEKNVYLQLLHDSSSAFEELINELKNYDEKTIVLFFGDHQPNFDNQSNKNTRDLDAYKVPFIIWANYDIEEKYNVETSTIYLQNYLLESANLPINAEQNYMKHLRDIFPVITKKYYKDLNGNWYKNEEKSSDFYNKLTEYDKIVYGRIFNK